MNTDTDATPRTDAEVERLRLLRYHETPQDIPQVGADFARVLEREAKLNCTLLEQEIDLVELLIRERDALKEELKQKQQPTLL